jgi:penicillin G amidase
VLESWTLHDRHNAAFRPPGAPAGDAVSAMTTSFGMAVSSLQRKLGGAPASWTWGRLHSQRFGSLTNAAALGSGSRAAGGDPWTVDAADGGLVASTGPSWRMITGWTRAGQTMSEGIYPGGQSEDPASAWYENLVSDWRDGRYLPMPAAGAAAGPVLWELRP